MGNTPSPGPEDKDQISIRVGNLNDVFIGNDGKLVRGVMIAYDHRGREVARGATYQEFMESLRKNRMK